VDLLNTLAYVRLIGAICDVEGKQAVEMKTIQTAFVDKGVWIRPFGKLIYLMPPYIIDKTDTEHLCNAIYEVLKNEA